MIRGPRALLFCWSFLLCCFFHASAASPATKKPLLKPINLNSATAAELQQVPGIGPATADKILQMRKSYGAFKSVDDLLAIRGIGRKRLDKMRKYLTVGKPATPANATRPANCAGCAKAGSAKAKAPPNKPPTYPAAPPTADEPEEPQSQ
jgi:competence protein ComEA